MHNLPIRFSRSHLPKLTIFFTILFFLPACTSATQTTINHNNQDPQKSPQYATRHALFAIYSNNPKLLQKTTWPTPNAHYALANTNLNQQQLTTLEKQINAIDLTPITLPKDLQSKEKRNRILSKPIHFKVEFQDKILPLTLMYKNDQWRLDIRWFVATNTPESQITPQQILCRKFIKAYIFKHISRIKQYTHPHQQIDILKTDKVPATDQIDDLSYACETMPIVQLKPGSLYRTISKEWKSAHNQTHKRITLIGLLNGKPIPFQLYKTSPNNPWLVDPTPWINSQLNN